MKIDQVVLERGHGPNNSGPGSYDPGATYQAYKEHLYVKALAEGLFHAWKYHNDFSIVLAPEESRSDIVQWVNERVTPTTLFLSLHMNSAISTQAHGVEVIYASNGPARREQQALVLAEALAEHLRRPLRMRPVLKDTETPAGSQPGRDGKPQGLTVLKETWCAAFMLELGFISNQKDRDAVADRGMCAVAEAIRALAASGV